MKLSLAGVARSIDQGMMRTAAAARGWLVWPPLIAVALGVTAWGASHSSQLPALMGNKLGDVERTATLKYVAVAAAGVFVLYLAAIALVSWRSKAWRGVSTTARLNALLSFCLAGPFAVALMLPKIETTNRALTLLFIACAAAACVPTIVTLARRAPSSAASEPSPWRRRAAPVLRWLAPLVVFAVWLGYSYFFSRLAITNHHGLNSRSIDLGIYDNIFYQSIHGNPLGCSFTKGGSHASAHFDPILVVLSPLYLLYPRAELILTLQAVWVGAGVIPLYLIARHKTGSAIVGVVLATVYALHPAVHGATMYEFHSLTLVGTPLLWALYFLERDATKRYFVALFVVLLVREDAALMMSFVAIYALLSRRPKAARMGWITLLISMVSFVVVKRYFMTSSDILNTGKDSFSFAYYYRDLVPANTGFAGMLTSLLTNPVFALKMVAKEAKLIYLATMLLPVAFLPLFAKPGRFMLAYGAIFTLLATRKAVFSTHFQYIMLLLPVIVMLVPLGLRRLEVGPTAERLGLSARQMRAGALCFMLVAGGLVSWKFGAIVQNASFRGGFTKITRELTDKHRAEYRGLLDVIAKLPPNASVTVTDRVGPHVSNRMGAFLYRYKKPTQYVLIDERELKKGLKSWHKQRIKRGELRQIAAHRHFKLFKVDRSKAKKKKKKAKAKAPKRPPKADPKARERELEKATPAPTPTARKRRTKPADPP